MQHFHSHFAIWRKKDAPKKGEHEGFVCVCVFIMGMDFAVRFLNKMNHLDSSCISVGTHVS